MPTGAAIPDAPARLLAAAGRILLRDGPAGLTSRAVTAEARCAKGVLHRHFASFDDFLAGLAASHAARIGVQAAVLQDAAGTGSVAGNLTTALVSLSGAATLAVISHLISRDGLRARPRRASASAPLLRETEAMIASYLHAERELGRIAANADTDTLAFALTASAIVHWTSRDGAPPEPETIRKIITALIPDGIPLPPC